MCTISSNKNTNDDVSGYTRPPRLPSLSEIFQNKQLRKLQSFFLKSDIGLTEEEFYHAINETLGKRILSEHLICRLFRQVDSFCRGRSLL
jgi:hypothetical protein